MRSRKPRISAGILVCLSFVALVMIGYIGLQFHIHNLFPMKYRLIGLGILAVFAFAFLLMGLSRGGVLQKVIGIFLCSLLLLVLDLGVLYMHSGLYALHTISLGSKESGKPAAHPAVQVDVKNEGFILYISGNDSYGSVHEVTRSDVNILMTVNPEKREVLLVSVPRDSYLPIAGEGQWQMDKLTHAGNYGIGAQIETINRALDITINYYVRMNFSSFIQIIDEIGGVDVDNPESFTAVNGEYFPEGKIHLDAERALMFVRERKNLNEGDFGRQKNQERVIQAVFKKVLGPDLFFNFRGIMSALSDSVETNMPADKIFDFLNNQLDHGNDWKFDTDFIQGHSEMGLPSYAMPGYDLWFFVPDEDSMKAIHDRIEAVLNGKE